MRPPADIGMTLAQVATPALIVELAPFERNLARMADAAAAAGVRLRPHAKTHRSPAVARRQIALGAVGVCCQTVGEAEAMVAGGVGDVLVSNEVVAPAKLARLAALTRHARVAVCADHEVHVAALERTAAAAGVRLEVLVELEVGGQRCGVAPGEPAVALARRIAASPGLRFAGLQAYNGKAQHIRSFAERREAIAATVTATRRTVEMLARQGLACDIVGGAGTGTHVFESASGLFNEIQAGSYVFMDADYGRNRSEDGDLIAEFEHSLFVLATVISRPRDDRAIVDAGLKTIAFDSGEPLVADIAGATYFGPSDEHGRLDLARANQRPSIGDKVRLIPGHCDPTVNLHDWLVGMRDGRVACLWPVAARGASS